MTKHQYVFETPHGLPPSCGDHDHGIPLVLGSHPPNVHPYRHIFSQKNGIKNHLGTIRSWSHTSNCQPLLLTYGHGIKERRKLAHVSWILFSQ